MPKYAKLMSRLNTSGFVPKSEFSTTSVGVFSTLFDTHVLEVQKSGPGKRVVVTDPGAFDRFIQKRYPSGLDAAINGAENRHEAVAIYRDSKRSKKSTREIVAIKVGSSKIKRNISLNGTALPVKEWCDIADVAALRLDDGGQLEIEGTVAFIENINVFYDFESLTHKHSYLIYTGGRISERILKSLNISGQVTHYGDYDPVGCDEFLRIKGYFPNTLFYCPENLENLFKRYGQKALVTKSNKVLMRLRSCKDPQVKKIVALMDMYNRGLEHELLIKLSVTGSLT